MWSLLCSRLCSWSIAILSLHIFLVLIHLWRFEFGQKKFGVWWRPSSISAVTFLLQHVTNSLIISTGWQPTRKEGWARAVLWDLDEPSPGGPCTREVHKVFGREQVRTCETSSLWVCSPERSSTLRARGSLPHWHTGIHWIKPQWGSKWAAGILSISHGCGRWAAAASALWVHVMITGLPFLSSVGLPFQGSWEEHGGSLSPTFLTPAWAQTGIRICWSQLYRVISWPFSKR